MLKMHKNSPPLVLLTFRMQVEPIQVQVSDLMVLLMVLSNCLKLNCKYIVEAANGPTTKAADEILEKRSITLIPDIFANSGGVIVSYFEWVQNIQELTWEREQVNEMLENLMTKSFKDLTDVVDECNCTFRMAAYIVALRKLVYAEEIKGIFP